MSGLSNDAFPQFLIRRIEVANKEQLSTKVADWSFNCDQKVPVYLTEIKHVSIIFQALQKLSFSGPIAAR
jgi:hypothetical protein